MVLATKLETMDSKDHKVGLFCHYLFSSGSAQYIILDVDDEGLASVNQSLSFCSNSNLHICSSCNGMILFSTVVDNHLHYSVFNVFTRQSVEIPQPQMGKRSFQTGFAFDGHHYQIIRLFSMDVVSAESSSMATRLGGVLEMEIFSSQTGFWRVHQPSIRLPMELPKLSTTPIFFDGVVYWEIGGHLLAYNISHGFCNLIRLPTRSMTFGQCLWESEGRLHYCYSDFEGIHTWVLLKEHELDFYSYYYSHDRDKFKWKLDHTVKHLHLLSLNPDIFHRIGNNKDGCFLEWKPEYISPFAFIEESQTMYLRLPGSFACYNLRNQSLKEVFRFEFPNVSFYCCLVFAVVYSRQDSGDENGAAGKGGVIVLPMTDAMATDKDLYS